MSSGRLSWARSGYAHTSSSRRQCKELLHRIVAGGETFELVHQGQVQRGLERARDILERRHEQVRATTADAIVAAALEALGEEKWLGLWTVEEAPR